MSDGVDLPANAPWWVAAIAASQAGIGVGVHKFLIWWGGRKDSYHAKLRAWEAEIKEREATLDAGVKADILALKTECEALRSGGATMAIAIERWRVSVILLVNDTILHRPASPALAQVRAVLADAFPIHLQMPPEMAALVQSIDERAVAS